MTRNKLFQVFVATALLTGATAASAAQFVLVNTDPPGVGFNDPTPAEPIGGNNGTTVGAQRLIAYNRALQQWGSILKSNVPIVVLGSFGPQECTVDGGVLASAGAYNVEINFPNAPLRDHWYHSALANSLAGYDLTASDDPFEGADVQAVFNGDLGKPGCVDGLTWYYGLDNRAAGNQIDFLSVFMHELSHGLGFQNFIDEATGTTFEGLPNFPDSNIALTFDNATGKVWNTMTPAEIVAAATRDGEEVWIGSNVTARAPSVLAPLVDFVIASPADIAGTYDFGRSSTFGATATPDNFYGVIVPGLDAAGDANDSINDGCSTFTNASAVAGKIAVVRRGGCAFVLKAKNAQLAGATGVIIGNNVEGIINMIGEDPTVTIPALSVTNTLGDALIAAGTAEGGLVGTPGQLAGADSAGRVRLYAPEEYSPGSSISHFDTVASPNLLMEPFINTGIATSSSSVDLTAAYFEDIGWKTELSIAGCGAGSGAPATTFSGVFLASPVFACANSAPNFGGFQSCATQYFNQLRNARLISEGYKGTFARCTAAGK